MFLGIDVGGTYTDAVLVKNNQVCHTAKTPTRKEDLLTSLIEAIKEVLDGENTEDLERIVLSTTLITNLIAEAKYDPVGLILMPGPGLAPEDYSYISKDAVIIGGAVDFRGREIIPLNSKEIDEAIDTLKSKGISKVAVVGKFSQRYNAHEKAVAEQIIKACPGWQVELGYKAAGQLNFPRRAATTLLTVAVRDKYKEFVKAVGDSLSSLGVTAPVYILKADGGTMPLEHSLEKPVDTIFSGPAASVLGVIALTPPEATSVMLDIGGTTTDLALVLSGKPLAAAKGIKIREYLTQVRSFAVKAIPLGGDSHIRCEEGKLKIGPNRLGPAYCLGGAVPTPTDALRALDLILIGDRVKALEAMEGLAKDLPGGNKSTPEEMAQRVLEQVTSRISEAVREMYREWEEEPAYRVWEILKKGRVKADYITGVGGAAEGIVPRVAAELNCEPLIPEFAPVANALGAALAQPTLTVNLRVDTEKKHFSVYEEGVQYTLDKEPRSQEEALALAEYWLHERGLKYGFAIKGYELIRNEVFNIIRGSHRVGRVYFVSLQTPWGILTRIGEGGGSRV